MPFYNFQLHYIDDDGNAKAEIKAIEAEDKKQAVAFSETKFFWLDFPKFLGEATDEPEPVETGQLKMEFAQ